MPGKDRSGFVITATFNAIVLLASYRAEKVAITTGLHTGSSHPEFRRIRCTMAPR
jgi:hypothetical protein